MTALLVATAAVCARAPAARPGVDVPGAFSDAGQAPAPARWWLAIDDPQLHGLIDVALADNPSLLATWARLAQAEAAARREGASAWPTLSGDARAGGSVNGTGTSADGSTSVSLGLAASYEVDLWGRLGAARDAAAFEVGASKASLQAAAITLTAQVATTWYDLVEARQQVVLLASQLDSAAQVLDIVELKFDVGTIPETDVLRQRQQVESIRGDQAVARARVRVLEHSLALLLGKAPGYPLPDATALPGLPPLPATGVPGELVQRRPDIVESYFRIRAADRNLAAAIANQFPRLSLSASASTSASSPQNLFKDWLASLVGNLVQPLIDGGARKAEVERTRAVLTERIHTYRGAVLAAIAEVEDALVREAHQHTFIASLTEQLTLATQAHDLIQAAYRAGAVDYLRVLDAQQTLQSLQRRLLTAHHDLITYRIALHRSLAGPF